jgi:hypothetical protein
MSEHEHVAAIKYSADQIDTEVKLASDLETIQIVCMNTSMIRADTDALAAKLTEARNDGIDLRRYATELEIALGQVSPLAKHIITDIRNECRITSEFMGENITGDLPDTNGGEA